MSHDSQKFRLVTRSDFDGLVCAVLLNELSLIDDINVDVHTDVKPYSKRTALAGLFLSEGEFDGMLAALKEKKNIVLQGAPGVGKSFVAKRLAYAFIGSDDPQRVQLIQFHQSYSYEDFVQGFRPTAKGHFELTPGLFYQFCRRAQRHEAADRPQRLSGRGTNLGVTG